MDNTVNQRIKDILKEYRIKQTAIVKHLNWETNKRVTVSYWLRQKTNPAYVDFLNGVFEILPQINPIWILTGEGEKYKSSQDNNTKNQKNYSSIQEASSPYSSGKSMGDKQYNKVIEMLEQQIGEKDKQISERDKTISRLLSLLEGNKK